MKRLSTIFLFTVMALTPALAQKLPIPTPQGPPAAKGTVPTVSIDHAKDLVIAYQAALRAYDAANAAKQAADVANRTAQIKFTELKKLGVDIAKEEGLPEGTDFKIDEEAKTATPVLPAKTPDASSK